LGINHGTDVRLADFIVHDMQAILLQWERFASTRGAAASRMTELELRDHAKEILLAVAKDLSTSQTPEAQSAKSMGLAPTPIDALETAAQTHGLLRARSGFNIKQMASEYRALRASVLRLWSDACQPDPPNLEDMIRFNEAIDQALTESVAFFSDQVDEARNLLLGMLGHDMRTPLQSILMTATYLGRLNAGQAVSEAAARLISSGGRMKGLLDELVEFNRANLGLGIHVSPTNVDLADLFAEELRELRAAYPDRELVLEVTGDTKGCWDGPSLQRLLGNLVVNAVKYGDTEAPVRVVIAEDGERLRFEVRNTGPTIDPSTLERLFEPLQRGEHQDHKYDPNAGLGLGLFITREIAKANGGEIEAHTEGREIVFSVRLPRRQPT
jgi:signal transduction histidine kinase